MRNNSLSIPPNKSAKKSDREMEIIVNKFKKLRNVHSMSIPIEMSTTAMKSILEMP